jgi:hypothetical protein
VVTVVAISQGLLLERLLALEKKLGLKEKA